MPIPDQVQKEAEELFEALPPMMRCALYHNTSALLMRYYKQGQIEGMERALAIGPGQVYGEVTRLREELKKMQKCQGDTPK